MNKKIPQKEQGKRKSQQNTTAAEEDEQAERIKRQK